MHTMSHRILSLPWAVAMSVVAMFYLWTMKPPLQQIEITKKHHNKQIRHGKLYP